MYKIFMASLGCVKNLVDAETMLGETLDNEFQLAVDPADADVIIVNTCGFIEEARNEGREVLREYLALKTQSGNRIKVAAAGCWAERRPEQLAEEFPGLDAIWGLSAPSSLQKAIRDLRDGGGVSGLGKREAPREGARLLTTLPSFAYLRISDGCDNRCHYCAIPLIRGGLRSRRPEAVIEEARALEDQGVKELVIISQDTTAYGSDRPEKSGLAELLERLLAAVAIPRIRLLYAHPTHLDAPVCNLLLREPRLCRYLDLPIQHISDTVLRRMGRGYGRERVEELLALFTGKDFTLRTTLLLGFPGETERDFRDTLDFVGQGHFRHLGAFAYSPEQDTPAFGMDGQVPAAEAAKRRDAILEAQSRNAFAWLDGRIGGVEQILADASPQPGWLVGRSVREAPDADGAVFLPAGKNVPGDIIDACITSREGYDLLAETRPPRRRRKK